MHTRDALLRTLKRNAELKTESAPRVFDLANRNHQTAIRRLLRRKEIRYVTDDYIEQERELFAIRHPRLVYSPKFEAGWVLYLAKLDAKTPRSIRGRWVYFPWRAALVHILRERDFQLVRTARNRNLITAEEQEKFYESAIGIAGLSVGESIALAIVLQGGGRALRLIDHDRLALSNLNRIPNGVISLGLAKAGLAARQIYELNPYAKIELLAGELNEKNVRKFIMGPPKLDVVIDEVDNLAVKFLLRQEARKHRIPLLTAADNADGGVIDIERYDLNPQTRFFHGRMGKKVSYDSLKRLTHLEIGRLITKWVGEENVPKRMQESLSSIGKTVVSWPQLGGAALMNGSAVAYCVRRILNRQPLNSDRVILSLDEMFVPAYNSSGARKQRLIAAKRFRKAFGI